MMFSTKKMALDYWVKQGTECYGILAGESIEYWVRDGNLDKATFAKHLAREIEGCLDNGSLLSIIRIRPVPVLEQEVATAEKQQITEFYQRIP